MPFSRGRGESASPRGRVVRLSSVRCGYWAGLARRSAVSGSGPGYSPASAVPAAGAPPDGAGASSASSAAGGAAGWGAGGA